MGLDSKVIDSDEESLTVKDGSSSIEKFSEEESRAIIERMENSDLGRFYRDLWAWWPKPGLGKFSRERLDLRDLIRIPSLGFKQVQSIFPRLTYRQINHWQSEGLIEPSRETEKSGWRKFSVLDVAHLAIITELRSYGVPLWAINEDLAHLNNLGQQKISYMTYAEVSRLLGQEPPPYVEHLTDLEANLCLCPAFDVGVIKFAADNTPPLMGPADVLVLHLSRLMQRPGSFMYVSVSSFVREAMKLDGHEFDSVESGLPGMLSKGYGDILWMIQNDDTEQVTITKGHGESLIVKSLVRKQGNFDMQEIMAVLESGNQRKVEVSKKDGKVLTITIEDKSIVGR